MGRELKRVPLNWDWPLDTIWKGYLNPYSKYSEKWQSMLDANFVYHQEGNNIYEPKIHC